MEKLRIFMSLGFLIALHAMAVFLFLRHEEFFHAPEPIGILSDHARDALVARNWLEGKGWTTPVLPLYSLNLYRTMGLLAEGPPWRNADRFPLPVVVCAGLMKLLGKSGISAIFLDDRLYFLLALIALYFLTFNEFRDARAAFLAGLLFITNTDIATSIILQKTGSDLFMAVAGLAAILSWLRKPSRMRSAVAGGL